MLHLSAFLVLLCRSSSLYLCSHVSFFSKSLHRSLCSMLSSAILRLSSSYRLRQLSFELVDILLWFECQDFHVSCSYALSTFVLEFGTIPYLPLSIIIPINKDMCICACACICIDILLYVSHNDSFATPDRIRYLCLKR